MKPFYFAILAALAWGVAPIVEKIGLTNIAPLSGVIVRSFGVIIGAIILLMFNNNLLKSAFTADPKTLIFLISGGIIASIIGQIFFYSGLKQGEASKLVPIAGMYPLVSFILGLIFLGETFTLTKGVGIIFVLLGVFFLR
jgi:bacterial/archaeal transporter family protein